MSKSYFTLLDESFELGAFEASVDASGHTVGPWSERLQHGGPPCALAVAAAGRAVAAVTERDDLAPRRMAADFVGPVPVGTITVRSTVVRAARSAALAETVMTADGRECLHARVWFVRRSDTQPVAAASSLLSDAPADAIPDTPTGLDVSFGYGASLDWRFVRGAMRQPGPGAAWVRATMPLVPGWDYSDLARVVLVADSASGVSAELDWSRWSFVNVDLDVHLARPLVGDWTLLDAVTQLGSEGSAVARSTISDANGVMGAGLQTLVLSPIPT